MPEYAQILQALGIQQPNGNPARGEASYPNAGAGFAAGLTDWHNQQSNQQKGRIESQREQLLKMIDSIPDSEENFLPKLKLKLDIQAAGTGGSHWSDKVLSPTKADGIIQGMQNMFRNALPQEQAKPTMAPQGQGPSFGVSPTSPGGGAGVAISPPVDNTGKLRYEDKGKWKDINEVFQDEETGSKYLIQIDANTGKTKRLDLGKAKTVGEIREETRAQARMKAKTAAVSKGFYETAVALSGIGSPEAFDALPLEVQNQYYVQAGQAKLQKDALGQQNTKSNIAKNNAIAGSAGSQVPLNIARTDQITGNPPKDPTAITADDKRTLDMENAPHQAIISDSNKVIFDKGGNFGPKEIKEAQARKTQAEAAIRRNKARYDKRKRELLQQRSTTGGQGSVIPKATPGPLPLGNKNDPAGIFN
jgi:hypothetical protein